MLEGMAENKGSSCLYDLCYTILNGANALLSTSGMKGLSSF